MIKKTEIMRETTPREVNSNLQRLISISTVGP